MTHATSDSLTLVQDFMDALAQRFTEIPSATYAGLASGFTGIGTNEGVNFREFGSSGFATPYYEQPPGNNQVRHTVGGLIQGYVRGQAAGLASMNAREDPDDPIHGVPDINLNGQTVPYGAKIAGPRGYFYGADLANWIRETLCAH